MGTLFVSQNPTHHLRIGNSLCLLRNLIIWKQRNPSHSFCYPWLLDRFPNYLSDSYLENYKMDEMLSKSLSRLMSFAVASAATSYAHQNNIRLPVWPYEGSCWIMENNNIGIPIVCNFNDNSENQLKVTEMLEKHQAIILHEPFPWNQVSPSENELEYAYSFLRPSIVLAERCRQYLDVINKARPIIGIHARLGDYKDWLGGQFYFSQQFYLDLCTSIVNKFDNCCVLLFSNEDFVNVSPHPRISIVSRELEDYEHFCMMQYVDILVGTVSTFSALAADIGKQTRSLAYNYLLTLINENDAELILSKIGVLLNK